MSIPAGFEQIRGSRTGGDYVQGAARKWLGHTVEGFSRNPRAAAAAHPWPPHCWVTLPSHPYAPRLKLCIIDLDRSAYALAHPVGTPETNKAGALQVEIEGFAAQAHAWSEDDLRWLAHEVVGPMCDAGGAAYTDFLPTKQAGQGIVLARSDSPIRVASGWGGFYQLTALAMHQHAPHNDHWDAPINLEFIVEELTGHRPDPVQPPPVEVPTIRHYQWRFRKPGSVLTTRVVSSKRNDVAEVQFCLNLTQQDQSRWTKVDGHYGDNTARLCRQFQQGYRNFWGDQNMAVDGAFGDYTAKAVAFTLGLLGHA